MIAGNTGKKTILLILYFLCAGAVMLQAQDSTMREVGRRDWAAALPDGEGKGLVLGACTVCHSLNSTVLQRKTSERWERTVEDMIARGAQLHLEEMRIVVDYLARNLGPDSPPLSQESSTPARNLLDQATQHPADMLPEGPGKPIIQRSCTRCHALDRITRTRKDQSGWQANLSDMIRLGAKVQPAETRILIAYLVRHFGPDSEQKSIPKGSGQVASKSVPNDPASMLPDKEGKALVLANCVQCHGLRYVTEQRKNPKEWEHTVLDMVARGAQITREETDVILRYLTENFPEEKRRK